MMISTIQDRAGSIMNGKVLKNKFELRKKKGITQKQHAKMIQ